MPSGADAVVIQENTRSVDGAVEVLAPAPAGKNVRREGSDLRAGERMLDAGARLGPGELGLLAAQRVGAVTVHRRPRVAILSTGDELRDITDPEAPGTIVNSNAYALAAQVQEAGGLPEVIPNVPDRIEDTVERIAEGLRADLLLTCGGVSVGAYDLVKDAFAQNGIEASFWKVRLKPGKPLTFGTKGDVPVVGLPGNPISAMVTFEVFVRPGLRAMLGDPRPYRAAHEVILTHDHRHSPGRPELARARVRRVDGALEATMHRLQGSGSLPSMVDVDALVLLPADQERFEQGARLTALLLRDELGAETPPFDA
jgi:molybdopterin molybdotransferase